MPHDETLARRLRDRLADLPAPDERRMFGGWCLMTRGNMICGVTGDAVLVRVGKAGMAAALALPDVGPMRMGTRTMGGFVTIHGEGDPDSLDTLLAMARNVVASLPPK